MHPCIEIIHHYSISILILIKRTVGYKYLLLHKQFIILKIMGYNNIESFRTLQKINIESNNSQNLELYLPEFFVNLFVFTSKK